MKAMLITVFTVLSLFAGFGAQAEADTGAEPRMIPEAVTTWARYKARVHTLTDDAFSLGMLSSSTALGLGILLASLCVQKPRAGAGKAD